MCRSIKTLHNFEPPATEAEVQAAALQFVRKVAGTRNPSQANQQAFADAVAAITQATSSLLAELVTSAPAKNREQEAAKARKRWETRAP